MRVSLNKKGGTDKLQGVTFVCSPVEALVIIDALRKVAEGQLPTT